MRLNAELMAEIPPGGRHAEAARGWLDGVLAEVFPDLLEGLRTRPVTRAVDRHFDTGPLGEPGQMLGEIWVGVTNPVPRRGVLYSRASWQRMLGSLGKSPMTVSISIRPLGGNGYPSDQSAYIQVRRHISEPEWLRFTFRAPASFTWHPRPRPGATAAEVLSFPPGGGVPVVAGRDAGEEVPGPGNGWPKSPELQDRWAGFVKRQAARIGACAGLMTERMPAGSDTVLQKPGWPPNTAMLGTRRDALYRYFWVTIIPPELAVRLGGAEAATASGAFCEVSELPDGSLWLRATPTLTEFTRDRLLAVSRALTPVLGISQAR
ncbi:MAG TPA: hypothetical protein VNF47_20575 [Streptosporangiaceae bacterium]|nr:hypothetical protein [Streptosporangiaceae bacterium]